MAMQAVEQHLPAHQGGRKNEHDTGATGLRMAKQAVEQHLPAHQGEGEGKNMTRVRQDCVWQCKL
jgi:hypothetical protein